jgi:hypothetical protein
MLAAGRTLPAATTAPVGRASDDSAQDDIRRALRTLTTATVLTGGLLLLLGVLLTQPPASVAGRPVPLAVQRLRVAQDHIWRTHKEGAPVTRDHDLRLDDGRILRTRDTGATGGDAVFLLGVGLGDR